METGGGSIVLDWASDTTASLRRWRTKIAEALSYAPGRPHHFDDIVTGVLTGRYRLWDWGDAYCISEVLQYPRERHYHLFLGGGRLSTLLSQHETLLAAAREAGCSQVTISGRVGWIRALRRVRPDWRLALCTVSLEVD